MKNRQAQKPPKQGGFFLKYITQGFEVSDFTNEAFDFKNIVSDFMREVRYFISGLFIYKTKNNT